MTKVLKRDGTLEAFNRSKLIYSIRLSGVNDATAREIVGKIVMREIISSEDIRRRVLTELRSRDQIAAFVYEKTLRLDAHSTADAPLGTVQLDSRTMGLIDVDVGDTVDVFHAGMRRSMKVIAGNADQNEIRLTDADLRTIDARNGTRLAVRGSKIRRSASESWR